MNPPQQIPARPLMNAGPGKRCRNALFLLAASAAGWLPIQAQFQSGSNGSYGPLVVTAADTTLDLPPDGVFHCTTIEVAAGRRLRFNRNALNTPVVLLATGDVTIAGEVIVSGARGTSLAGGQGGPGGFDGGAPGSAGLPAGDGLGPGGGKAGVFDGGAEGPGAASYSAQAVYSPESRRGAIYGSPLLLPVVGGSGGGGASGSPGWGGGGGGGALLIASATRIQLTGILWAVGGGGFNSSVPNSGSGGGVRLVAPWVGGTGRIEAGGYGGDGSRGDGRVRIDALDRAQLGIRIVPSAAGSVGGVLVGAPSPLPRLDVIEAAGRTIPVDSGPVNVVLPTGTPAAQTVRIRARDFGQTVAIRVVLTPDSGPGVAYDTQVDNTAANPAEVSVPVVFPVNVLTHVQVWTK
jgi:hypothetical protein